MNFDDLPMIKVDEKIFDQVKFPHSSESIQLIQTHISWVFLVGSYAYKLKKPVAFPFLDYSTLAKRQQYCLEEQERNRKWAGDLYVEIVGIHGELGGLSLGAPQADVEWAIKMHRFSQDDCLLLQAQKGPLPSEWIDDLAKHLVQTHQDARVLDKESAWGKSDSLEKQFDQCFIDAAAASQKMNRGLDTDKLREELYCILANSEPILLRRRDQGYIRECHGDLHLSNIIRWRGHTVGFDAIEFNPDFYWIDVWNDVAFTVMDLDWRSQGKAASRLINFYAEGSGDYDGLSVLNLYLAYRALVRARIAALRVLQNNPESIVARDSITEMEGYLKLSQAYFGDPKPQLWITHGVSGSGKSTAMEPMLERQRMIRIRSDVERKRLAGLKASEAGPPEIYTAEFTQKTYVHCMELAKKVLKAGFSVIIDATFLKHWQRSLALQLSEELSVPFHIATFTAPVDELLRRVRLRRGDASDADEEVVRQQLTKQEPLLVDEMRYVVEGIGSIDGVKS